MSPVALLIIAAVEAVVVAYLWTLMVSSRVQWMVWVLIAEVGALMYFVTWWMVVPAFIGIMFGAAAYVNQGKTR